MKSTPNHTDRDHNGKDISYIREAFKERRRLKEELGTEENSLPKLREMAKGRRPKSGETRKAITFRLTPSAIAHIKYIASNTKISQSDLIEHLVMVNKDEFEDIFLHNQSELLHNANEDKNAEGGEPTE